MEGERGVQRPTGPRERDSCLSTSQLGVCSSGGVDFKKKYARKKLLFSDRDCQYPIDF